MSQPSQEQLIAAFKAAADAGDEQAASAFAAEIQRLQSAPRMPSAQEPQIAAEKPSTLVSVGRGASDITQGLKQRLFQAADALPTPQPSIQELREGMPGTENLSDEEVRAKYNEVAGDLSGDYTARVNEDIARYEEGRGPDAGIDVGRIVGNAAMSFPLVRAIPGGASFMSRAGSGATQGGISGAVQFDPTDSGGGAAKNAAVGAGAGAVFAPLAGFIGDKLGKIGSSIAGRVRGSGKEGDLLVARAEQAVREAAPDLPPDKFRDLVQEATAQIRKTGNLSAEELRRKALQLEVGARPTKATVTRSPIDWSQERNLQKLAQSPDEGLNSAGRDMTAVLQGNDAALRGRLGEIGGNLPRRTMEEQGSVVMESLDDLAKASQKDVSKLYEQVRISRGEELASDAKNLAQTLDNLRDNTYAEKLVGSVTNKLKRFGMLDAEGQLTNKSLTVTQAEELRKFVNTLPNDFGRKDIIRAIDADVMGGLGDDAFGGARAAAAARKEMLDNPATQRALNTLGELQEGKTAQNFVKQQLIGGSEKDVKALIDTIAQMEPGQAKQATEAMRGGVLQYLEDAAINPNTGKFSGANFDKALRAIGDKKLTAILGEQMTKQIKNLAEAGVDLTVEPAYSAVNHSNTGGLLGSYFMPQLKRIAPQWMENQARISQQIGARQGVNSALRADLPLQLPQSSLNDEIALLLSRSAPAVAPAVNSELNRGRKAAN